MARYLDYIRALEADDGNPEGTGSIVFSLFVNAFGTDGNYGGIDIPLFVLEAEGTSESKGLIDLPLFAIEGYSGSHAHLTFPMFTLEAFRELSGNGSFSIPMIRMIADGMDAPPLGGSLTLPRITLESRGGPLTKIYQLCENENLGL